MNREQIYEEVYQRLRLSDQERARIGTIKKDLSILIDDFFSSEKSYQGHKYIGSTETGNSLKWDFDIDCVLSFCPFDKNVFRRLGANSQLRNIEFREGVQIVRDIFTGNYSKEKVGFIGIESGQNPSQSLEADVWKHPEFSKAHLTPDQSRDVILSKAFFRSLGVSGKSLGGGFSVEQLIAFYESFDNLLANLGKGNSIYVDFSGKYNGPIGPMVISYPYCGLKNLAWRINDAEFERISSYAKTILESPEKFLEDSVSGFNKFLWEKRGSELSDREEYSSPDVFLTRQENKVMRNVLLRLKPKTVLDIGCGNGFSTLQISRDTEFDFTGIDYSQEAIGNAKRMTIQSGAKNVNFVEGDMTNMPFANSVFDFAYMKRSLCNLPSLEMQKRAIDECARIIPSGGTLGIFELIREGYDTLTRLRLKNGLPPLRHPNHTRIPSQLEILEMTKKNFDVLEINDPTSTYYLATRFLYPLCVNVLGGDISKLKFDTLFHRAMALLPPISNLGANKLYLFRRK